MATDIANKDITEEDGTLDAGAAEKALDEKALDDFEAANPPEETGDETKTETKDETSVAGDDKSAGGDDEAVVDTKVESEEDWVTNSDYRELLESMSISEDDARKLSGPEELERLATHVDKRFLKEGQKVAEQETALDAQDAAQKKADAQERAAQRERDKGGKFKSEDTDGYKPDLDENEFDEKVIGEFGRLNEHHQRRYEQQEERIAKLEANHREAADRQTDSMFDTIVDSLDNKELFGTSEAPNAKARGQLRTALDTLSAGMKALGTPVDMTPALVKRALNLEFADELNKQHRAAFTRKVQNQSQRKLGGGGQRTKSAGDEAWTGEPEDDPVLKEAYDRLEK